MLMFWGASRMSYTFTSIGKHAYQLEIRWMLGRIGCGPCQKKTDRKKKKNKRSEPTTTARTAKHPVSAHRYDTRSLAHIHQLTTLFAIYAYRRFFLSIIRTISFSSFSPSSNRYVHPTLLFFHHRLSHTNVCTSTMG